MVVGERLVRVVRVISMIGSRHGATLRALADSCEVSERTIYRDIDLLCQAGYPVDYIESSKSYVFVNKVFLKPLTFSAPEAAALLWAADAMDIDGFPFAADLRCARTKLLESLPDGIRESVEKDSSTVDIDIRSKSRGNNKYFALLTEAMDNRQCIEIVYQSLNAPASERVVEPYTVTMRGGLWYLVGFCHKRQEVRAFRIDRISSARELERTFVLPEDFSVDEYFADCVSVVRGEQVLVKLLFSSDAARWVSEEQYHRKQQTELLADGRLLLTAPFRLGWELVSMIMAFGSSVEVLEPADLRAAIATENRKMTDMYLNV